jgi:hypothetical protein
MESAIIWAKEALDDDDKWIHELVINSAMAELRIFAFKTSEDESSAGQTEIEKFEEWMNGRIL